MNEFIDNCVWHGSLERAEAILAAHPEIAGSDIYTAVILGDDAAVRRFLALDPAAATAKGGPRDWDALTYLCFSRYLRLDRARSEGFVRAATALLDAGASANTGFFDPDHRPQPAFESALYGAAGVAHHAELTRLLLGRGADANDGETPYHAPETYDNGAVQVLIESGKLTAESLATMLGRKADFHDYHGIKLLLEHGADPNYKTRWGYTALQQALRRDNALRIMALMLDHGAKPDVAMAAREGRSDVLELFEQRGIPIELQGVDRLIADCACGAAGDPEPRLLNELLAMGGTLLAKFSGTGNPAGVGQLLDLGVPVDAPYTEGDGYWGIPKNALAIHVASWRAQHEVVKLLLERGSPVDAPGPSPLALAVRACVDSHWTEMRSPESVRALLAAGATIRDVTFPSGYAEVDELLKAVRPAIAAPVSRQLLVAGVARSIAFYRDVLGFSVQGDDEAVYGPARIQFSVGAPGPSIVFFPSADVAAMRAVVAARGGKPSELERVNWIKMRMFEIRDPDGHILWFGQSFQEPERPTPPPMLEKALPEMPLDNVAAGIAHYRDVLGFHINYAQQDLGVMDRDRVTVLLIARSERHKGIGSCYIYIADADALCAELRAKGANVLGDPVSMPWGLRQFQVLDPEGNRLWFGQPFE
jgi:predicted enzyme related to lactoylglutathione lyase/ankyrin repeat protein